MRLAGRLNCDRYGTNGDDWMLASNGSDLMYGGPGNDHMEGGAGDDYMYGEGGNDDMDGKSGVDRMYGGDGRDRMNGGGDDDVYDFMWGGPSSDTFYWEKDINDSFGSNYTPPGAEIMDYEVWDIDIAI